jgi:antitoxin VapB
MKNVQRAKLFQIGRSQAVLLPENMKFAGSEVYIKRVGDNLVLIPCENPWKSLVDSLGEFSDDFMAERAQPER